MTKFTKGRAGGSLCVKGGTKCRDVITDVGINEDRYIDFIFVCVVCMF